MNTANTSDQAYFCPSCGSSDVESSSLVGGAASCSSCQWKGLTTELVVHVFKHDLGTSDDVLQAFAQEFKSLIGKHMATPLAALLYKWGFFMSNPPTPEELTRYVVAVGRASINAILEVRRQMEKERVRAGN